MNRSKIFLISNDKTSLTPMEETSYAVEDDLQAFLARYPELLPGDQINPEDPRRWLLVAREMSVPDAADGSGRFSLDHLFLDQDGIPTFVECKRASDTRARREVVAQMLDYAANGVQYWPMDRLRQAATETAARENRDLNEKILDLLGLDKAQDETAIETFWQEVEKNLRAGKVRLLFVTDETPKELRRLVEFLNEKMSDVEVLAVEMKQFLGQASQTVLVPRVIGTTEVTREAKGGTVASKGRINRQEFMAKCIPNARPFFEYVLSQAEQRGYTIYWGTVGFSVRAKLPSSGQMVSFVYGYPYQTSVEFDFYFGYLPITDEAAQSLRQQLLAYNLFKEAGQKTLRTMLKEEQDLTLAYKVYDFILEQVDQILQRL